MKIRMTVLLTCLLLAALPRLYTTPGNELDTARDAAYLTELEKDIILELNLARTDPGAYAENYIKTCTLYPKTDVKDCYTVMSKTKAMGVLSPSLGMTEAARYHVRDQSQSGSTGHTSGNGKTFDKRLDLFGKWDGGIAENISYGEDTARGIVLQLLIDSGVSSRGHRKNILNSQYRLTGVAAGSHPEYSVMCVQDFAVQFTDKKNLAPSVSQSTVPGADEQEPDVRPKPTGDDEWDF